MLEQKAFRLSDLVTSEKDNVGSFTGKAAVYGNVDSYDDVIVPGACTQTLAELKNQIVVLCQHNPYDSIGMANLRDASDALYIDPGQLELGLQSARETYIRMQKQMLTGISIGYETVDYYIKDGIRYLKQINLFEVSLVTFPANDKARVLDVKSRADLVMRDIDKWYRELKEGRMLSSANMKLVQECHDSMEETMSKLKALIAAATPTPSPTETDGKSAADGEAKGGEVPEVKAALEEEELNDLTALRHTIAAIATTITR